MTIFLKNIRDDENAGGFQARKKLAFSTDRSIDQYSTCMLMLDSVPSRILAYVTCRVGRFFYRFCNSWPRVPDRPISFVCGLRGREGAF